MKTIKFLSFLVLLVALTLLLGCNVAPEVRAISVDLLGHHARLKVVIGHDDQAIIHHYYTERHRHHSKKRKGLPPGLAKKKRLPPGIEKQLEKNDTLPPGLEKRRLPAELERRLSALPRGYLRLLIGSDIIIINKQTGVIVDLMAGISL